MKILDYSLEVFSITYFQEQKSFGTNRNFKVNFLMEIVTYNIKQIFSAPILSSTILSVILETELWPKKLPISSIPDTNH